MPIVKGKLVNIGKETIAFVPMPNEHVEYWAGHLYTANHMVPVDFVPTAPYAPFVEQDPWVEFEVDTSEEQKFVRFITDTETLTFHEL